MTTLLGRRASTSRAGRAEAALRLHDGLVKAVVHVVIATH